MAELLEDVISNLMGGVPVDPHRQATRRADVTDPASEDHRATPSSGVPERFPESSADD